MDILMLYHRLPFPPNKGEKFRAYPQVMHMAARHRVWLASFVDAAEDCQYLPKVESMCHRFAAVPLNKRLALSRGGHRKQPLPHPVRRERRYREPVRQIVAARTACGAGTFTTAARYAGSLARVGNVVRRYYRRAYRPGRRSTGAVAVSSGGVGLVLNCHRDSVVSALNT